MMRFLCVLVFLVGCSSLSRVAKVEVKESQDGWRLLVDGKPFIIKGVVYGADKVGESANELTLRDWAIVDDDKDGRNDAAYQSWVDGNRNNIKDAGEKEIGDFQLLKEMGCNAIRIYHHASNDPRLTGGTPQNPLHTHAANKDLYRELYEKYGIRIMMGDLLGAYTAGSKAEWEKGTDYRDPVQRANMMQSVEVMVNDFKDEPYLLLWALGNENDFVDWTKNNSESFPKDYAKFVNEVALQIHRLDARHPVCLVNGDPDFFKDYIHLIPAVDIMGYNIYRVFDFGDLWDKSARQYNKPILLTEFGTGYPPVEKIDGVMAMHEGKQAAVHRNCWNDIVHHAAGNQPPGNAIGGFAFVWMDDWWEDGNPMTQDLMPSGWHHEWNGIVSQGNGQGSPLVRQLRKVYDTYQDLWTGRNQ